MQVPLWAEGKGNMPKKYGQWLLGALLGFGALWIGLRYVLPVALPFLLGLLLALAAEPVTVFCARRGRLPRAVSSGIGVGSVLLTLTVLLSFLGAAVVREIGVLMRALPDLQETARAGASVAQAQLLYAAQQAPDGLRPLLSGLVERFFSDGTAVMNLVTDKLPGLLGAVLGAVPNSALMIGTGILSGFMISARLPKLRGLLSRHIPEKWKNTYFPALKRVRGALWGWLKAQLLLCLVTYGIVTVGFLLMRIPFAPAWAVLVALVDAVPLLGTGTVLVPCAIVSILQGAGRRAFSYLMIYGLSAATRAVLEPRLVGKHLGLDPLVTLFAIYTGYRFWGFLGLIFAPMTAAAFLQILNAEKM
jgi:sporulation integral membrane protein YtvI